MIATAKNALLIRALQDRYRCPDEFLRYHLSEGLCSDPGYFEVGDGAVCYGRFVGGIQKVYVASCAPDSAPARTAGDKGLVLPFDPDEVIDNLRLERYPGCELADFEKVAKRAYYRFRPLTGPRIRRYVQKFHAANWKKKRFPQWPVDTTVENICEALIFNSLRATGVERIPFIWFWPDGARACVTITHDVETAAGRDFCGDLMDLDHSFGFKSSFQIVPESRYAVSQHFLNGIRDRGFELCIQDLNHDGRLFDDLGEFRRRAALINKYGRINGARGFRSGVLYRKPEWFKYLDFSFDMSIPNVAHLDPQRGGCCTVMPYFIGRIVELPLTTIQDYMLFYILNERSIDLWKLQMEIILRRNGLVTLLVHPDYIIDAETQKVYKKLLAMLSDIRKREPLWFALPGEVDTWWRRRSRMTVIRNPGSWSIAGEGAQRAKLAFARIADGQLIYELADGKQAEPSSARTTAPATISMRVQ